MDYYKELNKHVFDQNQLSYDFKCDCFPICQQNCPCQQYCIYNTQQKVVQWNTPAIECRYNCSCLSFCRNRVIQNDSKVELKVEHSPIHGLGVFAQQWIPQGKYITFYNGLIRESNSAYALEYTEQFKQSFHRWIIDASDSNHLSKYFNHSCSPNLEIIAVRIDSFVPFICFFTSKDIQQYEELTFQYRKDKKFECNCGLQDCVGVY